MAYIAKDDYPWPPTFVSKGSDNKKMEKLKNRITKDLTVDFFTTPDDLGNKVLQDLQRELPKHEFKIGEANTKRQTETISELLLNFYIMPKLFSGREFNLSVELGSYKKALKGECDALYLTFGAAIKRKFTPTDKSLSDSIKFTHIFASDEKALELSSFPRGKIIELNLITECGTYYREIIYKKAIIDQNVYTNISLSPHVDIVDEINRSEEIVREIKYVSFKN